MRGYTRTNLNSLGYLPPSERPAVIIDPHTANMNALGYQPDVRVRQDEGRFTGDTVLAKSDDMGLGKWDWKHPLGGKKSVFRQVANVALAPVKLIALPVLQAVGLKTLAKEANDGLIRQKDLVAAGKITQIAGAVAASVVLAPIVASAASSLYSTVASSALLKGAGAAALKGLYGQITTPKGATTDNSGNPTNTNGQPIDAQAFYDRGVADAKAGSSRSNVGESSAQAYYDQGYTDQQTLMASEKPAVVPTNLVVNPATETAMTATGVTNQPATYYPQSQYPSGGGSDAYTGSTALKDAVADTGAGLIPENLKPYLPYAIGGVSLLLLMKIMSPAQPIVVRANPYRRNR
jgi:hypothetical protein